MKHLIGMTSITYAVKAEKLLRANGIRVRIVPTLKTVGSGCGYSLELTEPPARAAELLRTNGIKIKEIYK